MNYLLVYNRIINKALSDIRVKGLGTYYETHHIIPRCLGGDNNKANLVNLTSKEHFICHLLLCKIHPDNEKLQYAFWSMCNQRTVTQHRYKPSARLYDFARQFRYQLKNPKTNEKWCKAVIGNKERGLKISKALKGRPSPIKGSTLAESHKSNISAALKGKPKQKKAIANSVLAKQKSREQQILVNPNQYTFDRLIRHTTTDDMMSIIQDFKNGYTMNKIRMKYNKCYPIIKKILDLDTFLSTLPSEEVSKKLSS